MDGLGWFGSRRWGKGRRAGGGWNAGCWILGGGVRVYPEGLCMGPNGREWVSLPLRPSARKLFYTHATGSSSHVVFLLLPRAVSGSAYRLSPASPFAHPPSSYPFPPLTSRRCHPAPPPTRKIFPCSMERKGQAYCWRGGRCQSRRCVLWCGV